MTFRQELGNRIRDRRLDAKMTQTQLAQQIGKSNHCVSLYETGRRMPTVETMAIMSHVLDASLDDMVPHVTYDIKADESQTTIFDVIGGEDD